MLLVADSGSTKCDWLLIDGALKEGFQTEGLNPLLTTATEIKRVLEQSEMLDIRKDVAELRFYGAGCSSAERNAMVESALKEYFAQAAIMVESDLTGAVRASCGSDAGTVCILGTGSNAVFYDGQDLIEGRPSMGFLLGDEGSGMHIGKRLLRDFFNRKMPVELAQQFGESYALNREVVLEKLYDNPKPNAYLASFAKFANDHSSPYLDVLVKSCFREFFEAQVLPFKEAKTFPMHFIGSIAYSFENSLQQMANEFDLRIGKIIQKPIFNLGEYHLKQMDQ